MTAPPSRYSIPAIFLHWAIAALILFNFYLGLEFGAARGLRQFQLFQLHKSVGFTILALTLLRVVWRLIVRPPAFPDTMKPWERTAANAVHLAFYVLILGLAATGWIIVSASPTNIPTALYPAQLGASAPHVPFIGPVHSMPMEARKALEQQTSPVHEWLAWLMITMLALHVGAALKHQFWNKDGVLYRMAPFLRFGARS